MSIEELVMEVQAGDLSLMEELWGAVVDLVKCHQRVCAGAIDDN